MDHLVAHPGHLFPWDLRISDADIVGNILRRLSDDLDRTENGILRPFIGKKLSVCYFMDEFGGIIHVLKNILHVRLTFRLITGPLP